MSIKIMMNEQDMEELGKLAGAYLTELRKEIYGCATSKSGIFAGGNAGEVFKALVLQKELSVLNSNLTDLISTIKKPDNKKDDYLLDRLIVVEDKVARITMDLQDNDKNCNCKLKNPILPVTEE